MYLKWAAICKSRCLYSRVKPTEPNLNCWSMQCDVTLLHIVLSIAMDMSIANSAILLFVLFGPILWALEIILNVPFMKKIRWLSRPTGALLQPTEFNCRTWVLSAFSVGGKQTECDYSITAASVTIWGWTSNFVISAEPSLLCYHENNNNAEAVIVSVLESINVMRHSENSKKKNKQTEVESLYYAVLCSKSICIICTLVRSRYT